MSQSEGYDNPPSTLAAPLAGAMSIAFDTTAFYWEDLGTEAGTGDIMKCVLGGSACTLTTLATSRTLLTSFGGGIAVDAKNVYWSDAEGIMKCSTAGGDPSPVPVVPGAQASWLVVHGTNVFWGDDTQGLFPSARSPAARHPMPASGSPSRFRGARRREWSRTTPTCTGRTSARVRSCAAPSAAAMAGQLGNRRPSGSAVSDDRRTIARIYWATCPDSAEGAIYTATEMRRLSPAAAAWRHAAPRAPARQPAATSKNIGTGRLKKGGMRPAPPQRRRGGGTCLEPLASRGASRRIPFAVSSNDAGSS